MPERQPAGAGRGTSPRPASGGVVDRLGGSLGWLIVKLALLGAVTSLGVYGVWTLAAAGNVSWALVVGATTLVIDWLYLSRRNVPAKYLVPGTLFLLAFQVYPILFNTYVAFTNMGTGNILTKEQAIEQLLVRSIEIPEDAVRYRATPLVGPDGRLALLLEDPDGALFLGTPDGLRALELGEIQGEGASLTVGDLRRLTLGEAGDRQQEVLDLRVPIDDGELRLQTFSQAARAVQTLAYDADRDVLVDEEAGVVYEPVEGYFVSPDGQRLTPGWRVLIGLDNFERLFTSPAVRGPFLRVFVWTYAFAFLSVLFTFAVGLGLAMALNDPRVRGLKLYRAILIVPYALPSFMTALIWQGLMNEDFGVINDLLNASVPWLADPWIAKGSVLLVNTWLGFPYMFLITLGALQAIPSDLKQAAFVDGASGLQAFRSVTLPLLLIAVAPLLIASFAFNFNNFNIIFLLTEGGPPIRGAATPAGHTDILISYTFRLAFQTGRGLNYGFAAAVSVIIFAMVAIVSAFSFRYTRTFEEIQ